MTELYHHGIKGQRWGVRRFQSPDGTLTAAGKARYKSYKKDWKAYDKLNRHVAASQRHLKEEGVMLDRVRDKYLKSNKAYEKEMRRSSGLFGLKGAEKSDRVANAQADMDKIGKDYENAAGKYGVAKKIAYQDTQELKRHVDSMIRSYGKGSINELQTQTVKIGQNKLQKLMQGAPKSIIFSKGRETEEFVKTGLTLADMPVVGNLYTANYIAKREADLERSKVETAVRNAKRQLSGGEGAKYIGKNADEYFKGVSSVNGHSEEKKAKAKAEKEKKKAEAKAEKEKAAAEKQKKLNEIDSELNKAGYVSTKDKKAAEKALSKEIDDSSKAYVDSVKKSKEAKRQSKEEKKRQKELEKQIRRNAELSAELSGRSKPKRTGGVVSRVVGSTVASVAGAAATAAAGPLAGYAAREYIKNRRRKKRKEAWDNFWGVGHSACSYRVVRSDELYHHGIKGQRWGVRRFQNPDGTLTEAGKAKYGKKLNKAGGIYLKKGSIVQRVSDVDETPAGRSDGAKHMYVAFTKEDKFRYKRCARSLGGTNFTLETPFGYQIDLRVKDDILAPNLKTQVDTAVEHVKNMSIDEVKEKFIDKKGYMKSNIYDDAEDFVSDLMKNNGSKDVSEFQQRAYLHYSRNLMKDKGLREEFFNKLSEKGYNAVVDYNDAAASTIDINGKTKIVKGFSDKPLIVFDSSKTLEKVGSHAITYSELADDAKSLKKMYNNRSALKKFGGAAATVAAAVPTAFVSPVAATAIAMYGGILGISLPGISDSNKAMSYDLYDKVYRRYANMQKNDPVAYKKAVNTILESVAKNKEAEKKAEDDKKG